MYQLPLLSRLWVYNGAWYLQDLPNPNVHVLRSAGRRLSSKGVVAADVNTYKASRREWRMRRPSGGMPAACSWKRNYDGERLGIYDRFGRAAELVFLRPGEVLAHAWSVGL